MKIKKIELRNFRLFKEKNIEFPDSNMIVLIGGNGTGKTAILDAIATFLSQFVEYTYQYYALTQEQAKTQEVSIELAKEISKFMTAAYEALGIGIRMLPDESYRFSEKDMHNGQIFSENMLFIETESNNILELTASFDNEGSLKTQRGYWEYKKILIEKLLENHELSLPLLLYHPTDRVSPKNIIEQAQQENKFSLPQLNAYKNAFQPNKTNLKDWIIWYKEQDYEESKLGRREKNYAKTIPALDNVRKVFETFFTTLGGMPFRILEAITKNGITTLLILKNNEELSLEQLSSGERALLSMIVDIASRLATLNPLLGKEAYKGNGIVLIDEIELHLHPKWQRLVLPALKATFPNVQFIVTTHSPFIVQSLEKDEIINLQNDENSEGIEGDPFKHSIEDIAEFEMGVEMPQRSHKFLEMERVASEYFALIAKGKTSKTDKEVANLRQQLNELEELYSDDPAFVAFLKAKRNI